MNDPLPAAAPADRWQAWVASAAVYVEPRVLLVGVLGFSSGLPLLLTLSTLGIWLSEAGVSKTQIGLFAFVGLPYTFKFAWAPLLDRLALPWAGARLGRRRGWALLVQILLLFAIAAMGRFDPARDLALIAVLALVIAFLSASQDIVLDALRIELLEERQQGAGAAIFVTGYRVGLLAAGAGALFVAQYSGWAWAFAATAALVALGMAAVLAAPEAPHSEPAAESLQDWLERAVLAPFREFAGRGDWLLLLAFIVLYKLGDSLAGIMAGPFYVEVGFTKGEIAAVSKVFGLWASIVGGVLGGIYVHRAGILKALMLFGILQLLSNLMFAVQAHVGADLTLLTATITIENVSGGMGTAAFVAYLSALCHVQYTATQYALLSALMALGRTALSAPAGWLAEQIDWVSFFAATTLGAVPGLLLLAWLIRRGHRPSARGGADEEAQGRGTPR